MLALPTVKRHAEGLGKGLNSRHSRQASTAKATRGCVVKSKAGLATTDQFRERFRTDWMGPSDLLPGMRRDSLMPSSWFCSRTAHG